MQFTLPDRSGNPRPVPESLRIVVTSGRTYDDDRRRSLESLAMSLVPIDSWVRLARRNGHKVELCLQGFGQLSEDVHLAFAAWGISVDQLIEEEDTTERSLVLLDQLMQQGTATTHEHGVDMEGSPGTNPVVRIATAGTNLQPTHWLRAASTLQDHVDVWVAPQSMYEGVSRLLALTDRTVPYVLTLPATVFSQPRTTRLVPRSTSSLPPADRRMLVWSHYRRKTGLIRIPESPDLRLARKLSRLWSNHEEYQLLLDGSYKTPALRRYANSLDVPGALKALHRSLNEARGNPKARGEVARTLHIIDPL